MLMVIDALVSRQVTQVKMVLKYIVIPEDATALMGEILEAGKEEGVIPRSRCA